MTLTGKAKIAGVIGWPVDHSRSPRLHGYWLKKHNIDGSYIPIPVKPENIAEVIDTLPKMGFVGANITVPHKIEAFKRCDQLTEAAKAIGAVNTLIVQENGTILGDNTDCYGFIENINAVKPDQAKKGPAVVYGAGGAARAVVYALVQAGCPEIRLVNRTYEKAQKLAKEMGKCITPEKWDKRAFVLKDAQLVINTTSCGLNGQNDMNVRFDDLHPAAVVNDLVYTPLKTGFLRRAAVRGNLTIDGLGMLLHQAVPGFAAWFGEKPRVDDKLKNYVAESL